MERSLVNTMKDSGRKPKGDGRCIVGIAKRKCSFLKDCGRMVINVLLVDTKNTKQTFAVVRDVCKKDMK